MYKNDYSREIFLKYYNKNGKLVKVTLLGGSVVEGIFAGFFHPDDRSEYIFKWHFILKADIEKYQTAAADEKEELGMTILQKDIKKVEYS
jgi:hypothetical protein